MYRSLAYIALLLISPQVFGGVFDPPPTDKSVELLGIIFGATVGDIYLGGVPNSALAEIMEKFNFIIVTAGMIVVSYAGIMSTINTAQEGTVMGKKWSAVWIPMRSIIGMLLMVPSPGTGYSMIQVTVMWIVLQGVGAADQLWTILLENLAVGNSASMGTTGSNIAYDTEGEKLADALLGHAICMEVYHLLSKAPAGVAPTLSIPPTYEELLAFRTYDAQLRHSQDNINTWIADNGSKVKYYRKVTQAAVASDSIPNGVSGPTGSTFATSDGAIAKGQALFGDSTDGSPYAQVCGRIDIDVAVFYNEYLNAANSIDDPPDQSEILKAAEDIYNIKQQTISTMLTSLQPLAEQIVSGEITATDPGLALAYRKNAIEAYSSLMQSLVIPVETGDVDQTMIELGKQDGWITAGSYYFTFNKVLQSQTFTNSLTPMASYGTIECEKCVVDGVVNEQCLLEARVDETSSCATLGILKDFQSYSYNLLALINDQKEAVLSSSTAATNIDVQGEAGESAGELLGLVSAGNTQVMEGLANLMSGDGEPLLAHAAFGKGLMIAAEVLWFLALAMLAFVSVTTGFIPFVSAGASITLSVATMVFGMVAPVLGLMWTFGATLAIYLPFIPYMIFTVTALGWLLTVVESIIAAPLIALGLVIPAGDEMGKLSTALMLLANIFLRPMLMIFGFILAANVYKAAITLVDYGMSVVIADVNANTVFSWVVIMVVYVTFIISLANTSFSLIYAVPDKILRWLGGPNESTSMDAISKTETGAKSGASQMGNEIGTSGKAMGKMVDDANNKQANKLESPVESGAQTGGAQTGGGATPPSAGGGGGGATPPSTGGGGKSGPPAGGKGE